MVLEISSKKPKNKRNHKDYRKETSGPIFFEPRQQMKNQKSTLSSHTSKFTVIAKASCPPILLTWSAKTLTATTGTQ